MMLGLRSCSRVLSKTKLWRSSRVWTQAAGFSLITYPRTTHFPVEGFADIEVKQEKRAITLHSYKYPSTSQPTKAIALMMYRVSFQPLGMAMASTWEPPWNITRCSSLTTASARSASINEASDVARVDEGMRFVIKLCVATCPRMTIRWMIVCSS